MYCDYLRVVLKRTPHAFSIVLYNVVVLLLRAFITASVNQLLYANVASLLLQSSDCGKDWFRVVIVVGLLRLRYIITRA